MLSKPKAGWSTFSLDGYSFRLKGDMYNEVKFHDNISFALTYLEDIPFIWVKQAIHGLETLLPFCVKAIGEPGRALCVVSYYNCYYIFEDDEDSNLLKPDCLSHGYSHTNMLQFCKNLYEDISRDIDEWAVFVASARPLSEEDITKRKEMLSNQLEKLNELITKNEHNFNSNSHHDFY